MASIPIHSDAGPSVVQAAEAALAAVQTVARLLHAVAEGVRRFLAVFG